MWRLPVQTSDNNEKRDAHHQICVDFASWHTRWNVMDACHDSFLEDVSWHVASYLRNEDSL